MRSWIRTTLFLSGEYDPYIAYLRRMHYLLRYIHDYLLQSRMKLSIEAVM